MFFYLSGSDIYTIMHHFTSIGVTVAEISVSSPLLGAVPPGIHKSEILSLNFDHLAASISKTVSRSVTCHAIRA